MLTHAFRHACLDGQAEVPGTRPNGKTVAIGSIAASASWVIMIAFTIGTGFEAVACSAQRWLRSQREDWRRLVVSVVRGLDRMGVSYSFEVKTL